MQLASSRVAPGMPLNIVQCTGQLPQQKIIQPQISVVPRLTIGIEPRPLQHQVHLDHQGSPTIPGFKEVVGTCTFSYKYVNENRSDRNFCQEKTASLSLYIRAHVLDFVGV